MATRPVLRIFISSTAVDLLTYREKVRDAVLRLDNLPIAMETFSAQSGQPADECMRMAANADAVICIVAHRYGYVPPKELGGDGERSITWLEVDAANRAGKPVYTFLVDPKTKWAELKEQDRLTSEPPEKVPEIVKAVQKLQEFKTYLEGHTTRNMFTGDEELAKLVAITVANFSKERVQAPTSVARVWTPLFCHALQPAQHFRGRQGRLHELMDWLVSPVTPDRVISVVAAGGTGKTALVHEALHKASLSDRAGVFVWSFYEDPHTDAFLRAAYTYFTGEKDAPAGGMLERLQMALSGDVPHVLVLDGLERVQSEGGSHLRGEVEDLQLERLVKSVAGGKGSCRALVTSRFPLIDLDPWIGAGHRAIVLDDLERSVALDLLRAWKVKGDDAALVELLEPLNIGGYYHALSVAVLGSYLGNFAGGDPAKAPEFKLKDAEEADPKARRLHRILEQYAEALTQAERDLLARLSLFPRGVKVEVLGWIVQSGGTVAGHLVGLTDAQLMMQLERLKALGLVFRYEADRQIVYSAHPFLREFFRGLLRTNPQSVHESVRAKLAPSLEARPRNHPTDPSVLDQYELLIEQTLLAGRVQEAFDLYRHGLGNFRSLGWVLGDYARGLRILERLVPQGDFLGLEGQLSIDDQLLFINDLGLYARTLGDLTLARAAYSHAKQLAGAAADLVSESGETRNLAELELIAGRNGQALMYSDVAVSLALEVENIIETMVSLAFRAASSFAAGDTSAAAEDFREATERQNLTELKGQPLVSYYGIWEAEGKLLQGDSLSARHQTQAALDFAGRQNANGQLCRWNAFYTRALLPNHASQADQRLHEARAFANSCGDVDLQLRCFHSACELQLHLKDYPEAIKEAESGILLADTCGFGKYSIDLRIALAETLLAAGDARKALQNAREALDRSEKTDCAYAWGKADGLHFCGVAHMRLGERELARQRLTAALELREKLSHGRVAETRKALAELG